MSDTIKIDLTQPSQPVLVNLNDADQKVSIDIDQRRQS